MNRSVRLLMALVVATPGVAVLPGIAASQQKSLKDTIIGSWSVTELVDQYESGKKINNWGTPKGNISFDGAGRFSQLIIGDAQPAMKTPDPRKPDAPVVAYYGSYTVNEGAKTINMKVEAASYSPRAGSEPTSTVEIVDGDTLILLGSPRKDQEGTFAPRTELKRAR